MTSKQSAWQLHPGFDAKRFFKERDSAKWVEQIYSSHNADQQRSRIALQSLERFLDSDVDRISGERLIKLFGWSAGHHYDQLQIQDKKVIKAEVSSRYYKVVETLADVFSRHASLSILRKYLLQLVRNENEHISISKTMAVRDLIPAHRKHQARCNRILQCRALLLSNLPVRPSKFPTPRTQLQRSTDRVEKHLWLNERDNQSLRDLARRSLRLHEPQDQ